MGKRFLQAAIGEQLDFISTALQSQQDSGGLETFPYWSIALTARPPNLPISGPRGQDSTPASPSGVEG
jgi:hypothetical protein